MVGHDDDNDANVGGDDDDNGNNDGDDDDDSGVRMPTNLSNY